MYRRTLFALCLFLWAGISVSAQAQEKKDNHFEVSKNLEIFNSLVKEVEMFYVDSIDVDKTVRRGIDAMLGGLDPYTEYIPEQEMSDRRVWRHWCLYSPTQRKGKRDDH